MRLSPIVRNGSIADRDEYRSWADFYSALMWAVVVGITTAVEEISVYSAAADLA